MNQILGFNNVTSNSIKNQKNKANQVLYKLLFYVSFACLIFFSLLFFLYLYSINQKENIASNMAQSFLLSTLYENNVSYSTSRDYTSDQIPIVNPFVIGVIKIDKLKIDYPILSSVSDELLEIAPCRFAGPMPNEVGNLCIAGHNYIDNTFFAKINNLIVGDTFKIYDLSGNFLAYSVFYKTEVNSYDLSCMSQDTGRKKIVTLMTCNSIKGTRIIVQGKEK